MTSLERLKAIGFYECGEWAIESNRLVVKIRACPDENNILYAFVIDEAVMYIGKSVRGFRARMHGYQNPHESQRTNFRNNTNLVSKIGSGSHVAIYVFQDKEQRRYGEFRINLAAGLEDSLVDGLKPPWNNGK